MNGVGPDGINKDEEAFNDRVISLSLSLLARIQVFIEGNVDAFCSAAEQEATYCLHSPGGAELLELVGYVYVQEAKQHQGRYLGLPAFWHTVSVASVTTRRNYFRCQRRLTACVQICQR